MGIPQEFSVDEKPSVIRTSRALNSLRVIREWFILLNRTGCHRGKLSHVTKTWGQSPRFRRNSASPIPSNRDIDEVVFPSNRQMIAERRNLPGESKYPVVSRVFERRTLHSTLHRRACGIFKQKPKRPVVTDDQERLGTIALPWEPILLAAA